LKPKKPNIATKQISESNVTIVVETHLELDTIVMKVDNQMVIIQVQVGKNIVDDVWINGGANVNIITENLKTKLGLPKPKSAPYHLRMAD
jgi:hypothetical protein